MRRIRSHAKIVLALGVCMALILVGMTAIAWLRDEPQVARAKSLINSAQYHNKDEAYFTELFGPSVSSYASDGGRTRSVGWPLTFKENDLNPLFLTVVFDASGHAIKATVHSW